MISIVPKSCPVKAAARCIGAEVPGTEAFAHVVTMMLHLAEPQGEVRALERATAELMQLTGWHGTALA